MASDAQAAVQTSAEQAQTKRPQTAYFLWLQENRAEVVKSLGTAKGSEVSKKAGQMWKALSEAQRAPYEERAREAREAFQAAKPAKEAKAAPEHEARKKPMTPVFAYIQEHRDEIKAMDGVKSLGDISKKGAELFKALPEAEQAALRKRFEESLAEYKAWGASEEGQAALAEKKGEAKAKKEAKQEKEDRKAAKGRRGRGAVVAPQPAAPAAAGAKRAAGEAAPDAAKRGRKSKPAPSRTRASDEHLVIMDTAVLQKAEALGMAPSGVAYRTLLEKLLDSDGAKGASPASALELLEKHGGLVNKARAELQAAAAGA